MVKTQTKTACPMDHHLLGLPCPHSQKHKDKKKCIITRDCGAHSGSTPGSVDFSESLFFAPDQAALTLADLSRKVYGLPSTYTFRFPFQLDHPPKSL